MIYDLLFRPTITFRQSTPFGRRVNALLRRVPGEKRGWRMVGGRAFNHYIFVLDDEQWQFGP